MPGVAGLAIAGLWYVLLGLVAPVVSLRRSRRGDDPRWHLAWRSFFVSAGMVVAFAASAWIGLALTGVSASTVRTVPIAGDTASIGEAFLRVGGFVGVILLAVLLAVQVMVVRERRRAA